MAKEVKAKVASKTKEVTKADKKEKPKVVPKARKSTSKVTKTEVKKVAKPEVKKVAKSEVKAKVKVEPKAEAKGEVKSEVKKVAKPEAKKEVEKEVGSEVKKEVKKEVKPEVKELPKATKKRKVVHEEGKTSPPVISTGRRKRSVARVRLIDGGSGKITINGRDIGDYFVLDSLRFFIRQPFVVTETQGKFDVVVNVCGGGYTGQTGAIRQGIAHALIEKDEMFRKVLKKAGFLSRDSRMKERKKYGLKKARKAPQFSKR